jgi:malate permease and related proteins
VNSILLVFRQIIPVLLLIFLGHVIRTKNFLSEKTIEEVKKLVVNITLPCLLFISFLSIEIKFSYTAIFVLMFFFCLFMIFYGRFLKARFHIEHEYFPFLVTGFEYGMLGVGLFGSAYGLENIGYLAIMDLGHELFIWFIFVSLLLSKRSGTQDIKQLIRNFLKSPVIIAIFLGIFLNLTGLGKFLYDFAITEAVISTIKLLGQLTIPLILLVVGYGIHFQKSFLKDLPVLLIARLVVLIPMAFLGGIFMDKVLGLDEVFKVALFTLFILPPPFIIPIYIPQHCKKERLYVNNSLTSYTIISIIIFIIYFIFNPMI